MVSVGGGETRAGLRVGVRNCEGMGMGVCWGRYYCTPRWDGRQWMAGDARDLMTCVRNKGGRVRLHARVSVSGERVSV